MTSGTSISYQRIRLRMLASFRRCASLTVCTGCRAGLVVVASSAAGVVAMTTAGSGATMTAVEAWPAPLCEGLLGIPPVASRSDQGAVAGGWLPHSQVTAGACICTGRVGFGASARGAGGGP